MLALKEGTERNQVWIFGDQHGVTQRLMGLMGKQGDLKIMSHKISSDLATILLPAVCLILHDYFDTCSERKK